MNEITINLRLVCGERIYTRDDGHILYDKITEALKNYEKVIVQFNEKEIASESFLDEAIVEHYLRPYLPNVDKKIILRGVSKSDQTLLKRIFEYRKKLEEKKSKKWLK